MHVYMCNIEQLSDYSLQSREMLQELVCRQLCGAQLGQGERPLANIYIYIYMLKIPLA